MRQNLEILWDVHLDEDHIRDSVESVVYDHRDQSVRATFIRPAAPDTNPDSTEVEFPLGKRKRRKA